MAFEIKVDNLDELQRLFKRFPAIVGEELKYTVKEVASLILETEKKEAPIGSYKGGNLRRSIEMKLFNIGAMIGPGKSANYALYVHEGTGIFGPKGSYITPKKAKMLAFRGRDGRMVFAKRVAGQKPNPFVQRTVDQTEAKVNSIIDKTINNILQKI